MKKLTVTTLIITACLSANVMAEQYSHDDYAKVVSATPVYEHVEYKVPIQTSRNIDSRSKTLEPKHRSAVPVVVGGVIGGVVGHSIGSSRTDKQIGMIAGTIIGATIGANIKVEEGGQHHQHAPDYRSPTGYRVKHEQILIGYDIIYQYHGHRYHTHTKYHPGKRIRLPEDMHSDRKHRNEHPDKFAMDMRHHDRRY